MTDAGPPTSTPGQPGPPPNVNALVEALEARARQAGSEGAMTLLRGMLGTLSETMGSIEDRLARIEARTDDQSGEMALAEAVQSALTSFNARLGRLEEAFVQAVEESGSGTQQIVDQIREAVVASLPSPAPDASPDHPAPAAAEPPFSLDDVTGGVVAALADRLDAFERRLGMLHRVEETVRGLHDDVRDSVGDVVRSELAALPQPEPPPPPPPPVPAEPALDPALVARIEDAVAALGRDEASARTIALVEERIAAVVKAVGDRSDALRDELQDIVQDTVQDALAALPQPEPSPAPEQPDLSALDRIEEAVRGLHDGVRDVVRAELAALPRELPDLSALDRVEEAVRGLHDGVRDVLHAELAALPRSEPPDLSALARVEEAVRELRDRPQPEPPPAPEPLDLSALDRIEEAVRELRDRPQPEPSPAPEPLDLSALARIEEAVRELRDRPQPEPAQPQPPPPPIVPPPIEIPVYELSDIVHRESELLTQRVAALAVGVEATRALVEQLVTEIEGSLGHKATEVGRKLAADLGLRSRRATKRRDRELGPGA